MKIEVLYKLEMKEYHLFIDDFFVIKSKDMLDIEDEISTDLSRMRHKIEQPETDKQVDGIFKVFKEITDTFFNNIPVSFDNNKH